MKSCSESTSFASGGLEPTCTVCTRNVHGKLFRVNNFVREKCIITWMNYSTTYCSRHLKLCRPRHRWGRPHSSERFARGQLPLPCTKFSQSIALRDLRIILTSARAEVLCNLRLSYSRDKRHESHKIQLWRLQLKCNPTNDRVAYCR